MKLSLKSNPSCSLLFGRFMSSPVCSAISARASISKFSLCRTDMLYKTLVAQIMAWAVGKLVDMPWYRQGNLRFHTPNTLSTIFLVAMCALLYLCSRGFAKRNYMPKEVTFK